MGRPFKVKPEEGQTTIAPTEVQQAATAMFKPTVKVLHLHQGLDLMASKTSSNARESDIYELPHGLLIVSKKSKRKIVVPYANIRGYELL